jgi:hypothetical protein
LKLPLSTTYVTFMVAMGTSLADRAWGRDSAVYRVAGVLNVVGGWFATALIAFVVAGTYAILLKSFGVPALVALLVIGLAALVHSHRVHRRRLEDAQIEPDASPTPKRSIVEAVSVLKDSLDALAAEQASPFQQANRTLRRLSARLRRHEIDLVERLKARDHEQSSASERAALSRFALEQDLVQTAQSISSACEAYVRNAHPPLSVEQAKSVEALADALDRFPEAAERNGAKTKPQVDDVFDRIEQAISDQVEGLRKEVYSHKNSRVLLGVYLELENALETLRELTRRTDESAPEESPDTDEPTGSPGPAPAPG